MWDFPRSAVKGCCALHAVEAKERKIIEVRVVSEWNRVRDVRAVSVECWCS